MVKTKTFQLDGLNLYITNVETKAEACIIAHACRWGVTEDNLIEVERLPAEIEVYGILNRPKFESGVSYAVDPMKNC